MAIFALSNDPQIELECQFVQLAIAYPNTTMTICRNLSPDVFTEPRHREFWQTAVELGDITAASVQLPNRHKYDWVLLMTSQQNTDELFKTDVSAALSAYQSELIARYNQRILVDVGKQFLQLVNAGQTADAFKLVDAARNNMAFAVKRDYSVQNLDIEALWTDQPNIMTGHRDVDKRLWGLPRGQLTILAARPGLGKTALALDWAVNIATAGQRAAFFSIEMSAIQLWTRYIAPKAGVSYLKWVSKNVTAEQIDAVRAIGQKIKNGCGDRLEIVDERLSVDEIYEYVASRGGSVDVVIVDHLHLIRSTSLNPQQRIRELGYMTEQLKELAKRFNCSVVLLCQLNRGAEGRDDKRPMLSDLRESGEIEQNADIVIGLYRDSYYDVPSNVNQAIANATGERYERRDAVPIELNVLKNRTGACPLQIVLLFDIAHQTFRDYNPDQFHTYMTQDEVQASINQIAEGEGIPVPF